jgi:hypothetical protein
MIEINQINNPIRAKLSESLSSETYRNRLAGRLFVANGNRLLAYLLTSG